MLRQKLCLIKLLMEDDTITEYEEDNQLVFEETAISKILTKEMKAYEGMEVEKECLEEVKELKSH